MSRHTVPALVAVLLALAVPPGASAHAVLLETRPANDAIAEESPTEVVLRFDEPVETALGSIRVFDASGERVDDETITQPRPQVVSVGIGDELERGTYTVTWRAISADSDPISGAFVFHVEEPGEQPAGIAAQVLEGTPLLVSIAYTTGRFLDFSLLLLCAGGIAALVYALRTADARLHRRLYGILAGAAAALAVVALVGLALQGAAAGGFGLGEAFRWDVVSSVAETRYGNASLVRGGLAAALVVVALALRARAGRGGTILLGFAALLAVGLVVTPSASGHASVAGPVAFAADVAHVLAAATWTGGLAFVVLALVFATEERWPLATRSVPRFSTMALVAVGVLLIAGAVNGYLQIGAWRGLWETQYGLLLLGKIALVLPLLALGAFNNRYAVPALRAGVATPSERRRFLRAAGAELAVMIAIVGVTAVLVNAPPAKTEIEMHAPAEQAFALGDLEGHVQVEPGETGRNQIHLAFMHGNIDDLKDVRISATLASKEIGPLRFEARPAGHTGFVVPNAQLSPAGDWQLRIEARRGEFDLLTATVSVPIR
ncbi:MAG TPA: CopD family protein [Gaiellaceae bacterium]|nr:CopD family protein [Gaiellaceae bacterium]